MGQLEVQPKSCICAEPYLPWVRPTHSGDITSSFDITSGFDISFPQLGKSMNLSLFLPTAGALILWGGHQEAQEVADFSSLGVFTLGLFLRVGGSIKHILRQESLKKCFETTTCSDLRWGEGNLTYKASFPVSSNFTWLFTSIMHLITWQDKVVSVVLI